jgi:hypothetical protein
MAFGLRFVSVASFRIFGQVLSVTMTWPGKLMAMNDKWGDISGVDPLRSIDLVWTLRDIKAKRTLLPVDPDHLRELIDLGLVEARDDVPVLTNAGHQFLD